MIFLKFLIICIVSVPCFAQQDIISNLETITFQKDIVSKLTGVKSIVGEDTFLSQRSSPEERQLATDYLAAQLNIIGIEVELQAYATTNTNLFLDLFYAPVTGVNVVAELPATKPSHSYVILGAHYDSERMSPGAIDNATGIALILDVVNRLNKLQVRNVNFLVVFFDQEEDNEVGSRAFVKQLKATEKEVHSAHIFDLIGWDANKNNKIALQSPPIFLEQAYQHNAISLGILVDVVRGASSDNKSFLKEGYKTVLVTDEVADVTPYYHSPKDDMSTVDFDYLALVSQFVFKTLKIIANE